jgi:membrane protein
VNESKEHDEQAAGWRLTTRLRDLVRFLRFHVLERELPPTEGLRIWLLWQLRLLCMTLRSFRPDSSVYLHVGALTYSSVLAAVPLLVVAVSLFQAFGALRQLEAPFRHLLVKNLAVGAGARFSHHFNEFIDNINAGALGGAGTVFLVFSVIMMMGNVENAFNSIWSVRKPRSLTAQMTTYWSALTLGPALLGLSLSLTASVQQWSPVARLLGWWPSAMVTLTLELGAMAVVCVAFSLFLGLMPNTRVRRDAAIAGGVVAGVLWHGAKVVYLYLAATTFRYGAIYGALGAVPIFFIWIYVSWTVLLFGARYSRLYQQGPRHPSAPTAAVHSQRELELLALRLVVALVRRLESRRLPAPLDELAQEVNRPASLIQSALRPLVRQRFVIDVEAGGQQSMTLGTDPHRTTVQEIVSVLRAKADDDQPSLGQGDWKGLAELLRRADEAAETILGGRTLHQLAGADELPAPRPASALAEPSREPVASPRDREWSSTPPGP